jgi:hypothetical protein
MRKHHRPFVENDRLIRRRLVVERTRRARDRSCLFKRQRSLLLLTLRCVKTAGRQRTLAKCKRTPLRQPLRKPRIVKRFETDCLAPPLIGNLSFQLLFRHRTRRVEHLARQEDHSRTRSRCPGLSVVDLDDHEAVAEERLAVLLGVELEHASRSVPRMLEPFFTARHRVQLKVVIAVAQVAIDVLARRRSFRLAPGCDAQRRNEPRPLSGEGCATIGSSLVPATCSPDGTMNVISEVARSAA